ncbi:hypothetical protein AAIG39_09525 [Phytobacter palmae]|uniref:Uncharacterized protein n=1 Tax=Phytobacter palmae TaxID=1855371 RepID=A0ABU9V635_9ENTR
MKRGCDQQAFRLTDRRSRTAQTQSFEQPLSARQGAARHLMGVIRKETLDWLRAAGVQVT